MNNNNIPKKQKIAFFIPSLRTGGAERVFVNLVNYLVKTGVYVDLIVCTVEGSYVSQVDKRVRIIDLEVHRVAASFFSFIRYLRQEQPIAVYSTLDHANLIVILAKIFSRYKGQVIIRVANTISQSLLGTKASKRWIRKYGIKMLYAKADTIITNSLGSKIDLHELINVPDKKIQVINNAVDFTYIHKQASVPTKHRWLINDDYMVILAVGKIHIQKDYETLLEAFSLLKKERNFNPIKLIIAGRIIQENEFIKLKQLLIEKNIHDDVDFLGNVGNPYAYMSKVDVYVLSSRWEGSPNTLIEALACGAAVVSTDCPSGPREILENGLHGILVPVGDAKKLSNAIYDTIHNKTNNQLPILPQLKEKFSVSSIAKQYLELLD